VCSDHETCIDAISVDDAFMHEYTIKYIMHKTFQTISMTY